MAQTTFAAANVVDQWADKFFVEYVRDSRFKRYMGTSENSIIQVLNDLTKQAGDQITVSVVHALSGSAVTGDSTLEGNEEALPNYGHQITITQYRNAVRVGKFEQQQGKIPILNAGRMMLKLWCMAHLRDMIIDRMQSPNVDGLTTYASTSEANKDTWVAAQNPATTNERVLFGAAKSNYSGDHSVDLANVDGTNDDLHQDIVSLMRRMAKTCSPAIRPVRVGEDEEWYVLFAGSLPFRDLESNMSTIHQNAAPRSLDDNPLFRHGDLVYNNVIIREVPEISVISGVGASSIDVAPVFLCGAQAIGLAWAQRPKFTTEAFDYGNLNGVAIAEMKGAEKLTYNSIQHGMVTGYVSAVGD